MRSITQFRVWNKETSKWIYSGRTPSMLISFWKWVATNALMEPVYSEIGLKDMNGTEIYEGDIVKCRGLVGQPLGPVVWNNDMVTYQVNDETNDELEKLSVIHAKYIEVVGNIYENSDLLEGK